MSLAQYTLDEVSGWSEDEVGAFLHRHGMGEYAAEFAEQAIDGEALTDCAEWDGGDFDELLAFPGWPSHLAALRDASAAWHSGEGAASAGGGGGGGGGAAGDGQLGEAALPRAFAEPAFVLEPTPSPASTAAAAAPEPRPTRSAVAPP